ncbi:MAG TPA: serine hydrolase [Candidatus Dormibacteraeota bacterium]|nr:serine hydrolase [Candidatus Dormibacteraeota bacterium]
MLKGGIAAAVVGALFVLAGFWAGFTLARPSAGVQTQAAAADSPNATPTPSAPHPSFDVLQRSVTQLLAAAGAVGGVTVTELEGGGPRTWSFNGDQRFVAASTYKLPLLMEEAQNVTAGKWHGTDRLCYQDSDQEDGYFNDYQDGTCMSRSQLEHRVGLNSDNTAAHILVRYSGGGSALNRYAQAHGAKSSSFYDPNTTTTNDLARLWVDEYGGKAGGKAAQQYLYPILTKTSYEQGIPAGVPSGVTVVHKIGILDDQVNDAALIQKGPRGAYVLTICTQGGPGGDAGWKVLADISRAVWQFEASRPA